MTKKQTAKKSKPKKQSRKPEFEQVLQEISAESIDVPGGQVGKRPGPPAPGGRDPGAEDSQAPPTDKASQALAVLLKIPFSIWANVSNIPEIKISDTEAAEWAEPTVDLLEYYFPGRIPEIVWIWLMFLSATEKVIDSRVKISYEKKQERKRSHPSSAEGPRQQEPAAHTTQPAPKHNGAEPAESYPQE